MIQGDTSLVYSLENEIEYLKSIINELQLEVYKLRCTGSNTSSKKRSKRDELLHELNNLKSKRGTTKKDKDNIYTLEMVLKNMK